MFCPYCGRENPDDASNCVACGALLPDLTPVGDFESEVAEIARRDGKIAAVKFVREKRNLGLKDAKDEVEAILADLGVELPRSGCLGMLLMGLTLTGALGWFWN